GGEGPRDLEREGPPVLRAHLVVAAGEHDEGREAETDDHGNREDDDREALPGRRSRSGRRRLGGARTSEPVVPMVPAGSRRGSRAEVAAAPGGRSPVVPWVAGPSLPPRRLLPRRCVPSLRGAGARLGDVRTESDQAGEN